MEEIFDLTKPDLSPEPVRILTWLSEGDDFRRRSSWSPRKPAVFLDLHAAVLCHTAHLQLLDGVEQRGSWNELRQVGPAAQVQHVENVTLHSLQQVSPPP